jgi:hypothetical protein
MKALNASIGEQDVDATEFFFASDGSRSYRGQVALVELNPTFSTGAADERFSSILR